MRGGLLVGGGLRNLRKIERGSAGRRRGIVLFECVCRRRLLWELS